MTTMKKKILVALIMILVPFGIGIVMILGPVANAVAKKMGWIDESYVHPKKKV
jgi:hypothetical protein